MTTVKVAGTKEVTVRVAVADPPWDMVMLEGVTEDVRPGVDTVGARAMLPEKPFTPARVMVAVPFAPAPNVITCGFEDMLKSTTFTVMVAEWDNGPFVPVMVTVYCPGGEAPVTETLSVERTVLPAVTATLLGLVVRESPPGTEEGVRAT